MSNSLSWELILVMHQLTTLQKPEINIDSDEPQGSEKDCKTCQLFMPYKGISFNTKDMHRTTFGCNCKIIDGWIPQSYRRIINTTETTSDMCPPSYFSDTNIFLVSGLIQSPIFGTYYDSNDKFRRRRDICRYRSQDTVMQFIMIRQ